LTKQKGFPEETREELKFLVEHFRKLAQDKDQVIATYRDFLEKLKPFIEREHSHIMKFGFLHKEIRELKDELAELTRKLPKKKKRNELV
jgi:predicted transcriptional regulator